MAWRQGNNGKSADGALPSLEGSFRLRALGDAAHGSKEDAARAAAQAAQEERAADAEAQALEDIASDILTEARASLMMAFRFMDAALWAMPSAYVPCAAPLATDGKTLYANPHDLALRFKDNFNQVARDYLHALLHCVFRQPFDTEHEDAWAWSLACDVVVETVALDMCKTQFTCDNDKERAEEAAWIQHNIGTLSPYTLYREIMAAAPLSGAEVKVDRNRLNTWYELFTRDSHEAWLVNRTKQEQDDTHEDGPVRKRNLSDRAQDNPDDEWQDEPSTQPEDTIDFDEQTQQLQTDSDDTRQGEGEDEDQDQDASCSEASESAEQDAGEQAPEDAPEQEGLDDGAFDKLRDQIELEYSPDQDECEEDQAGEPDEPDEPDELDDSGGSDDSDEPDEADNSDEEARERWERISKQMELDIQSFSKRSGGDAGSLIASLAVANRTRVNYTAFLRQFSTIGEDMKINDDEFDYIFYTYGLKQYGNMPLVEPLEYQETNRVREFVIALDTSGSCAGDLIKRFVQHTYDILRESEGFGDKVNIHIIQCDARVQADLKIENARDLEKYCETFQAFGFGSTDFRPVFEYVDGLIAQGEFENLRGLIYFTDGIGTFPQSPPPYETAFVFLDETGALKMVPPWAMRVVLNEDDIRAL